MEGKKAKKDRVLPGLIGSYRVLKGLIGSYRVLWGQTKLPGNGKSDLVLRTGRSVSRLKTGCQTDALDWGVRRDLCSGVRSRRGRQRP